MIGYLQGLRYRIAMRLLHRFHCHYTPPRPDIDNDGSIRLWCEWCGMRSKVPKPTNTISA